MTYNKEKIKKFNEYTIEDYRDSLIIEDIAKISLVEKPDGSYTQIGIRPLIDDDIFTDPSFHESLPGAGRMVAIGEEEFLISNLVNNPEIEKISFKEDLKEFPKHIYDINNAIILLSTKFYVEFFTKLSNRIDYEADGPKLDKHYKVVTIPEKIMGNRIIILNKDAILWKKQRFLNEYTQNYEKIDIKIVPKIDKADITLRSVNKMEIIDNSLIKIFEVENGKKS